MSETVHKPDRAVMGVDDSLDEGPLPFAKLRQTKSGSVLTFNEKYRERPAQGQRRFTNLTGQ